MNEQVTDAHSETLIYCPYCGADNYIQSVYTASDTTGVVRCIRCGHEL